MKNNENVSVYIQTFETQNKKGPSPIVKILKGLV